VKASDVPEEPEQVRHSYCRQCLAVCGLLVTTQGDRIVSVRGDPDHPVTHGYTCPKGRAMGAMHHDPRRLDRPQLRRRGELVDVSWNELLDDLAERVSDVIDRAGPDAVGTYFGSLSGWDPSGRNVAETYHRRLRSKSRYTSVTTDCPAKPLVAQLMLGHAALVPLPDLAATKLAIFIGTNPVVSHGHTWALPDPVVAIRALRRHGEVWVVDPRTTETARLATRHLAPRAGTDHTVLAHLVREVLRRGADEEYVERCTTGVESLRAAVEPFTAEHVEALAGVDRADLGALVDAVSGAGRVAVLTGTGVTMGANANVVEWLATALPLVTGSIDRPGGMWFNPGVIARLDQSGIDPLKNKPAQPGPPSRPELPRRFGQYPCAALADEIEAGNLRALLSIAGNPVTSVADSKRLAGAVEKLDVLAVADLRRTATVERATHVLPCTGPFERPDATLGAELYQPEVASQYVPALVAPGADRRSLWWICAQLGRRLGFDVLPAGLDPDSATDEDVLAAVVGAARLDELRAYPSGTTSEAPRFGWVTGSSWFSPFDLAPAELVEQLRTAPVPERLVLIPRRQVRHLNSWFPPSELRQDAPLVLLHPADADEAGIADGQGVRVSSSTGELVCVASIDRGIARGAVSVPHGFDGPGEPHVGELISDTTDLDPLTGMVLQSGVPVSIKPLDRDS
jgi:anaerobic selenocysteine-containing dehydrogenase